MVANPTLTATSIYFKLVEVIIHNEHHKNQHIPCYARSLYTPKLPYHGSHISIVVTWRSV